MNGGDLSYYRELSGDERWDVYAFEANPVWTPWLEEVKNILKDEHNVYLYNETAAWIQDGEIEFHLDVYNRKPNFLGSSLRKDNPGIYRRGSKTIVVKCRDVAGIINNYSIDDFIVIKMDIEGAEYDLILDFIKKNVFEKIDIFAIEFHPRVHNSFKNADLILKAIHDIYRTQIIIWK